MNSLYGVQRGGRYNILSFSHWNHKSINRHQTRTCNQITNYDAKTESPVNHSKHHPSRPPGARDRAAELGQLGAEMNQILNPNQNQNRESSNRVATEVSRIGRSRIVEAARDRTFFYLLYIGFCPRRMSNHITSRLPFPFPCLHSVPLPRPCRAHASDLTELAAGEAHRVLRLR